MRPVDDGRFFNIRRDMGEARAPSQARHILIDILGGRTESSEILGWPLTKIESCLRSGFIRCQDHAHVLVRAQRAGKKINELDFVVHLRGLHPPVAIHERTAAVG